MKTEDMYDKFGISNRDKYEWVTVLRSLDGIIYIRPGDQILLDDIPNIDNYK